MLWLYQCHGPHFLFQKSAPYKTPLNVSGHLLQFLLVNDLKFLRAISIAAKVCETSNGKLLVSLLQLPFVYSMFTANDATKQ
jgi:hypothetical protein